MRAKIIQTIIILAVIAACFFAFYLQRAPVSPEPTPTIEQPKIIPPKEKVKKEIPVPPYPTFVLPVDVQKDSHFGILGEGRGSDFADDHVNKEVLNQLFDELKVRKVQAVFFSGNTVAGVEKGQGGHAKPIDNMKLQEELTEFSQLYHNAFGNGVPIFPALGDREIVIPGSAKNFIDVFNLKGAEIFEEELLYTVSAGQAFFAVIATDEFLDGHTKVEEGFTEAMLEWLDSVLKEGAKNHKYLFVVGYEPAFPSTTTFSIKKQPQRDAFWRILAQNKVLAYFSSKEHLFDRSNRYGVWQIISGGGGAPVSQGGGSLPFYHALVLTIPGENKEMEEEKKPRGPSVQVIDNKGNMVEEFTLGQENQPLYQMRIS